MGQFGDRIRNGYLFKVLKQVRVQEISVHSAHACYFIVLSVFPALVLLLGLLRHTRLQPEDLMNLLEDVFPVVLQPYIRQLISSAFANTSKTVISVSVFTGLWSAGRGIHALMKGLNTIYGIQEQRGWLGRRILSAGYMVMFLLLLLLTLVLHVFGNTIVEYLRLQGRDLWVWMDLINWRFFLLAAVQTLFFSMIYRYLPDRRNGWRESLPGALLTGLGWMAVSALFSAYVDRSAGYANVFGSMYTAALTLLWLYLCVGLAFFGAALNRIVQLLGEN